mmetsp:Transcript_32009/g.73480  ORF Transcript_32009/g.73480 Transcript_32009/m.73480 type:complete len:554 (-) Transcript_32009:184-1845(-)
MRVSWVFALYLASGETVTAGVYQPEKPVELDDEPERTQETVDKMELEAPPPGAAIRCLSRRHRDSHEHFCCEFDGGRCLNQPTNRTVCPVVAGMHCGRSMRYPRTGTCRCKDPEERWCFDAAGSAVDGQCSKCSPEGTAKLHFVGDGFVCFCKEGFGGSRCEHSKLPPVILIPPFAGTTIWAKLHRHNKLYAWCFKDSEWFRLWLTPAQLLLSTSCQVDNIMLEYDDDMEPHNKEGVETKVDDWGGTSSIDCLTPNVCKVSDLPVIYGTLSNHLVNRGYVRGYSLLGAPYDWRYTPASKVGQKFLEDLKKLIEDAVERVGHKAVLVSHSMGGLYALYLLSQQSQEWKDRHVAEWISVATPFGGARMSVRTMVSGVIPVAGLDFLLSSYTTMPAQRTFQASAWLLPVADRFGDAALVMGPSGNYSAQDLPRLFDDIGFPLGQRIWNTTKDLTAATPHPGVPVTCLHSTQVPTPIRYDYRRGWLHQPRVTYDYAGDGTACELSLRLCETWQGETEHEIRSESVGSGVNHKDCIKHERTIEKVEEALSRILKRTSW